MTEDKAVKALMEETRQQPPRFDGEKHDLGTKLTCGCCVDPEFVIEVIEPLLRRAYQAGFRAGKA